jgi:integrase
LYFQHVQGLKVSTKDHYQQMLVNVFDSSLGDEPITLLTPERIKAYIHERRGNTSDIQIRHELTAISSVLEWAAEWGIEGAPEVNPTRLVRKKSLGKAASHSRAIEPEALQRILDAAKRRSPGFWLPFVTLLLETGLRHEEALGLTWPQVDMQRGVINLEWFREKTNRGRIVPLSSTAIRTLAGVRRYDWSPYVFTNVRTRKRYHSIWAGWGRLRTEANCSHIRIHDIRHTFASYTRRLGMDRLDRKAIMGHSSEESHELYSKSDEATLRGLIDRYSPSTLLAHSRELGSKIEGENETADGESERNQGVKPDGV